MMHFSVTRDWPRVTAVSRIMMQIVRGFRRLTPVDDDDDAMMKKIRYS